MACLAAAVLYEAGDDRGGQTAVAQVILNRVRHPAFPKTVCGVVFQGSNRKTGCQFTFTCDGALGRDWPAGAWERARKVAAEALGGAADPRVGLSTHYHTNWVVPAWSAQMDKVAQVGTHLFFRWRGSWGSSAVFGGSRRGVELVDPRLLARPIGMNLPVGTEVSAVPQSPSQPQDLGAAGGSVQVAGAASFDANGLNLRGAVVRLADESRGVFVLHLPRDRFSGDYAMASLDLCRGRAHCMVLGYLSIGKAPAVLPVAAGAARHASFFYDASVAHAYWDCSEIARSRPSDCIPGTAPAQVSDSTLSRKSGQGLVN